MATAATTTDPKTLDFVLGFFKLKVDDIDRMTSFYKDAFGFVVENTLKFPAVEERMLQLPGQVFTLVLLAQAGDEEISIGTGHGPVGITTSDVEAAAANVTACGGTIEMGPVTFPGATVALAKDPEGHEIEILCLDGSELQLPDDIGSQSKAHP